MFAGHKLILRSLHKPLRARLWITSVYPQGIGRRLTHSPGSPFCILYVKPALTGLCISPTARPELMTARGIPTQLQPDSYMHPIFQRSRGQTRTCAHYSNMSPFSCWNIGRMCDFLPPFVRMDRTCTAYPCEHSYTHAIFQHEIRNVLEYRAHVRIRLQACWNIERMYGFRH